MIIKKWLLAVSFGTLKATFVLRNCLFSDRFLCLLPTVSVLVSLRSYIFFWSFSISLSRCSTASSSGMFFSTHSFWR